MVETAPLKVSKPTRRRRRLTTFAVKVRETTRTVSRYSTPTSVRVTEGLKALVDQSEALALRVAELAQEVQFTVTTTSVSGEPLQAQRGLLTAQNLDQFRPRDDAQQATIERFMELGFRLVRRGRFSVSFAGPAQLVGEIVGEPLLVQARTRPSAVRSTQAFTGSFEAPLPTELFLAPATSLSMSTTAAPGVDHVVFIPPPIFFAPTANAPAHGWHGPDEAEIRTLLRVPVGADGAGVRVAMVDTGFYNHPYFTSRGLDYRAIATASAPRPQVDDGGHGTAMAFNVFAVAPRVSLMGFQQTSQPQDALEDADDQGADIISCSWGYDSEQVFPVLQASLLDILRGGKLIVFAAGNGHYAWPGSEPGVITAGGVYIDAAGGLQASNYASGYMSSMFPGRRIPDVCGLVGQTPKAIYIMMPTRPGSALDKGQAGPSFPSGDATGRADGWAGASGTSAAAPQLAGVLALMLQKARSKGVVLTQEDMRRILTTTARPVSAGRNAMGFPAVGHPNTATGFGLIDATAALALI